MAKKDEKQGAAKRKVRMLSPGAPPAVMPAPPLLPTGELTSYEALMSGTPLGSMTPEADAAAGLPAGTPEDNPDANGQEEEYAQAGPSPEEIAALITAGRPTLPAAGGAAGMAVPAPTLPAQPADPYAGIGTSMNLDGSGVTRAAPPVPAGIGPEPGTERAAMLASLVPALATLFGGNASYAARVSPNLISSAIGGQMARNDRQTGEELKRQHAATEAAKARAAVVNAQARVAEGQARIGLEGRKLDQTDRKLKMDETEANRDYELDLKKFKETERKATEDDTNSRAEVKSKYETMMLGMTTESQIKYYNSLDPDFVSHYGITLPGGGLEKQNPNAPTREMLLQKALDAQYRLLSQNPKHMTGAGREAVVKRINNLEKQLGLTPGAGMPADLFTAIDPATAKKLANDTRDSLTRQRGQEETKRHNQAMEAIGRRQNQLRADEIEIKKSITKGGKDPVDAYLKVQKFVKSLYVQKSSLMGNKNMFGEWEPASPEQLAKNKATIDWVDSQIQTYTNLGNRYAEFLNLPPITAAGEALPEGTAIEPPPGQPGGAGWAGQVGGSASMSSRTSLPPGTTTRAAGQGALPQGAAPATPQMDAQVGGIAAILAEMQRRGAGKKGGTAAVPMGAPANR